MEQTKLISIRVSVKVLNEVQKIESDIELDRSTRIKKILEYGVKKMKEEKKLSFAFRLVNYLLSNMLRYTLVPCKFGGK